MDYSISEPQVKCLARCIDRFGKDAFTKLYVNNNGLTDSSMSILLDGVIRNVHIQELEIAFNPVQERAVESLARFFDKGRKQIKKLKLARTKTGTKDGELLLEALSGYR